MGVILLEEKNDFQECGRNKDLTSEDSYWSRQLPKNIEYKLLSF